MQQHYFLFSIVIIMILTSSCGRIYISIHGLMSEHRRAWIEAPALMESTKNPPTLCQAVY